MRSSLRYISANSFCWFIAVWAFFFNIALLQAKAGTPGDTLLIRRDADIYCRPAADAAVCSEAFAWNLLYVAKTSEQQQKDFYPVSLKPGGSFLGWVRKADAAVWPHRIAVGAAAGVQQAKVYCAAGDIQPAVEEPSTACWLFKAGDPMLPVIQPGSTANTTSALRVLRMQRRFAAPATVEGSERAPRDAATIRPPFQHAPYLASRIPKLPTRLDLVFVIEAEVPHKTIRAVGSAIEGSQGEWKPTIDARFALAVVGSDGTHSPYLYPRPLEPAEFIRVCKTHNSSQEPPAPEPPASQGSGPPALAALQRIAAQTSWRDGAQRHLVLLAPGGTSQLCGMRDGLIEHLVDNMQPGGTADITLHIRTSEKLCGAGALQLVAGNRTPGTAQKYAAGAITQLLREFNTGLSRRPPLPGAIYAVSAPAGIAAAMPAVRQAPPWSPRYLSAIEDPAETPGVGYIARESRVRSSSFQPYVLVEHRELTMFAAYLEFTVNGLRRQESGSEEVARTLANMQRFEVNLVYGRPLSSPAAGPSGFAAELNSLPATTPVLSATAVKLASMSQTDYTNWIKQAARCHTAIRKLLDNNRAWNQREGAGAYTWLPMRDLP